MEVSAPWLVLIQTRPSWLTKRCNPVDAELFVGGLKGNTDYHVAVTNLMGMTVMPMTSIHTNVLGELIMTVGEMPAGVYFILVNDGTNPVMVKFVKR